METVEVSQSALESLQKMVEQLQGELDEWRSLACRARDCIDALPGYPKYADICDKIDAKCIAKPEVLE